MLSVSGLMSTNTGTPPRSTTALAVETKVKDGMMTSSPGPMSSEERRHLERRGAGMGEEHRAGADPLPEPGLAAFGVGAVAGKLPARDRVADVVELHAGKRRTVEGDGHAGAPPRTQQLIGRASAACHTRPAGAAGNTQSRCSRKKNTVVTPSPNSTTHSWRCPRRSTPR